MKIDCTGDAVKGDIVTFAEAVFGGSFRKPTYLGDRTITAQIVNDSYGAKKQQHTFTLRVIAVSGAAAAEITVGDVIRRKGRNVYKNGCTREPWADESARLAAAQEKHQRGDSARAARDQRRAYAY